MMGFAVNNTDDKVRLVREELNTLPGPKKDLGSKFMICCPYHNDKNPSAIIGLDPAEREGPVGWMFCFGCDKSVSWNDLATTLNLRKFARPKKLELKHFADPKSFRDDLFGSRSERLKFPELKELDFQDDFPFKKWRGVKVDLLKKIGAQYVLHSGWGGMPFVWLPVYINKELRGYVKAKIEKPKDDKPSYLNAKAEDGINWSRKWGLLYFDYAIKLMKKQRLKTMVLCEGPRDSLRYLDRDIPATSVLGAMNWSSHKRELLEDAGVENLILSFDGDDAGIKATRAVYKNCKHFFDVKYLALWKYRTPRLGKNGKQMTKDLGNGKKQLLWDNEMDPFSCPDKYIDSVEGALR
jgi:hypothetical protein